MAKNTFLSFDTTASNNTDIAGIDIQGTAAVMNFDNAFRQLMAILRTDLDNGQVFVTKAAGYTALAADNNAFYEFTAAATLALTAAETLAADWHMMVFANGGAVTINPDGAELINGAATLVVADGDTAYIICTGTAFKAITIPSAASVALKAGLLQPYADVASATTTDIGAAASQNVNITGTTTITGFGTVAAGTVRDGIFADILTLTHNGTSLILPGAANITTAAGDSFRAVSLGSGNWRVTEYERASGRALVNAYTLKYASANIAVSLSASGTLTHGLGGIPDAIFVDFVCLTAEGGYAIGEVMPYHVTGVYDGATNRGVTFAKTSTSIKYKFSSNALQGLRLDTGANFTITPANWEMVVRAAR
jgi:hypothetical protein